LSYEGHNLDQLITVLERDSITLIDWFTENQMKANPDKFQAIAIGNKTKNENISPDCGLHMTKWYHLHNYRGNFLV
jgi:hypothetical protein